MDGKQYFREVCKQNGVDCDTFFKIGSQNTVNNSGYVYRCPHLNRKDTQLFAVNYLKALDVYIAWDLNSYKAKTKDVFRVLKSKVTPIIAGEVLLIDKAVEYSGWNEETVYVFDRTAIELFIKKYVIISEMETEL